MARALAAPNTTVTDATSAISGAAARVAAVLRRASDPVARVPGLDWTLSETAVHLATETREYAGLLTGDLDVGEYLRAAGDEPSPARRSAILNARQVHKDSDRDPDSLARSVESAAEAFTAAVRSRKSPESSGEIRVSNGLLMAPDTMAKVILGEYLVHGLDIARAAGSEWHISRPDALQVIDGVMSMVPDYVDPEAARSLEVSYELRLRGGPSYRLDIDHGTVRIGPAGGKVDCKITADPVAYLLVGYRRSGQWGQILRGKMVAGGAKPWLGLKFGQLFTGV